MTKENFETIIAFPAFELDGGERRRRPPVNVLPMAACVENQGISSVRVIDGESMGLSSADLAEEILRNRPQIIGVSVYTPSYPRAKKLVARVKELRPEALVVLGGKHPTHRYWEVLEDENVDFVVVGEGEETLPKIVAAKASNSTTNEMQQSLIREPGVAFKGRDFVPLTRRVDLESLPPINWKILYPDLEFYLQSEDNFLIEDARGCFGECTFCLAAGYRKGISFKPPERFVEEMRFLSSRGFNRFFLTDDDAMVSFRHIQEVFQRIKDVNLAVSLCVNVRPDSLLKCTQKDDGFLSLAKEAGLEVLYLGVESGSPEILEYCKKGVNLQQIEQAIRLATQTGLVVKSNFIVGLPYDSEKTIRQSIDFALRLRHLGPHLPHVSIFMPYPGTEMYDEAVRENLLDPRTLDLACLHTHKKPAIPTKFLSREKIEALYNEFYDRLYTPRFMDYLRIKHPHVFVVAKDMVRNV